VTSIVRQQRTVLLQRSGGNPRVVLWDLPPGTLAMDTDFSPPPRDVCSERRDHVVPTDVLLQALHPLRAPVVSQCYPVQLTNRDETQDGQAVLQIGDETLCPAMALVDIDEDIRIYNNGRHLHRPTALSAALGIDLPDCLVSVFLLRPERYALKLL